MNNIDYLKKLSDIMGEIEEFIDLHGDRDPALHRQYMIDLCSISLTRFIDKSFSYDQAKNLVANMIRHHDVGGSRWHIDVENCTADRVAIVNELDSEPLMLPINIFLMSNIINGTQNDSNS